MKNFKSRGSFLTVLLFAVPSIMLQSCGWDPMFYVKGKCITTRSKNWFNTVHITTDDPSVYYFVKRNYDHDGSNNICFDNIPEGYIITRHKDTIESKSISFDEGQTVTISYSGGDRAGVHIKCIMRNDSLIVQE